MITLHELGIRNAITKGNTLALNVESATQAMLIALADDIVRDVKENMTSGTWVNSKGNSKQGHISSGKLLNSTGIIEQGHDFVTIGSTSNHAGFHEFGTSKMQAHPIFQPIISSKAGRFTDILIQGYEDIAR